MKKLVLSIATGLALTAGSNAQDKWTVDVAHSSVKFAVTHMLVSEVEGSFRIFSGEVTAKDETFNGGQVDFSVDVASINTNNDNRDGHLKSEDFFNAEKYPQMTFKSTAFTKLNGNKYSLAGNLTIKDVTKPVTFDVTLGGIIKDHGTTKAGFKATTTIKRMDYNLKWNKAVETGGMVVSDDVQITVNVELKKN